MTTLVLKPGDLPKGRSVVMKSKKFGAMVKDNIKSTKKKNNFAIPATVFEDKQIDVVVVNKLVENNTRHLDDKERTQPDLLFSLFCGEQRLYGREKEKDNLIEVFHRRCCASTSTTRMSHKKEITLVTGHPGTGKTALANTLREHVVEKGGHFISGKFDLLQNAEPYAIFVTAFTEYVHLVIEKGKDVVASTKETILHALGTEICLMTEMIPALELLVGQQNRIANTLKLANATKYHKAVFCKFVRAICSYDCPLVLLIDDLQWSDDASIDLVEALVIDDDIDGLMVLGTCRHNEMTIGHKLSAMLRRLEDDELAVITDIQIRGLSKEQSREFVSNTIGMSSECTHLSEVIFEETKGNVFFILQLLMNLYEDGVLYRDSDDSQWHICHEKIPGMFSGNHDVIDVLVRKIEKLPFEVKEMLMVASCIGAGFDEYLLCEVLNFPNLDQIVAKAVNLGLIVAIGGQHEGYKFIHDQTQQAAYLLIPEEERNAFHLDIGRNLRDNLPSEELDLHIFTIVNQLRWGVPLMQNQEEKNNMASLCLRAGEKAAESSEFMAAASYLQLGIDMLDEDHWRDQYFISLDLYNTAAEMEFCNANFDRVDILVDAVLANARILRDKMRVYTLQICSLGARKKFTLAIEKGLEVLKYLGHSIPPKAGPLILIRELIKTKRMLRRMTNDDILKLRNVHEWEKTFAMQVMNLLGTYSFLGGTELFAVLGLRMVQLTLRYGMCHISAAGFAAYAVVNVAIGNFDDAFRYGDLALVLLDKFNSKSWLPRVYSLVYFLVYVWKKPVRCCIAPLRQAHQIGLQSGDMEYSMVSSFMCGDLLFISGQQLCRVKSELSQYYATMAKYKQDSICFLTKPILQVVLNFMGKSEDPLVLTGEFMDEELALEEAAESMNFSVLGAIYIMKLIIAYYFNDYELAVSMARASNSSEKSRRGVFLSSVKTFYHALSCLALAQESRKKRRTWLVTARRSLGKLKELAANCPENFKNKVWLIEAEFDTLKNKADVAMIKYNSSIEQAKLEGLQHEYALACERKGRALIRLGDDADGLSHLSRACSLYEEWGAHAKVGQLRGTVLN